MVTCGMDEVGRGALAGPLVAAAVATNSKLKSQMSKLKLKDSKLLKPGEREKIYRKLIKLGVVMAVEIISARQINTRGMGWANKEVFKRLVRKIPADKYIADGNLKIAGITSIIKADTKISCQDNPLE